jgi:hypothetical protein
MRHTQFITAAKPMFSRIPYKPSKLLLQHLNDTDKCFPISSLLQTRNNPRNNIGLGASATKQPRMSSEYNTPDGLFEDPEFETYKAKLDTDSVLSNLTAHLWIGE